MKLLIAGGGTGGHIYIGIALAQELRRRVESIDFLFVGTRRGLESHIVPQQGYRLEFIDSAGLKGMSMGEWLRNAFRVPRSLLQSRRIVRAYAPDVAVGLGGYASGPVMAAAWWLGTPALIVEPNALPGLTNRWLGKLVDRAALALPEAMNYFGTRGIVTGIPVRAEFHKVPRKIRRPGELTLLVYGGSQGSHALNSALCGALHRLKRMQPALRIIHQTGAKELGAVRQMYREAAFDADVRPFLPRIFEEFATADLILARAGAGTVAELTVTGKAAILVPFPGAADDHQTKNAMALQKSGAAKMLPQTELTPERIEKEIGHFWAHPEEIDRMEEAARKLAKPDAAEKIADLIVELAER